MTADRVTPPPPPGPPTGPPAPGSPTVEQPGRLVALALVGGLALDLGLRGGITNLAVTVGLLVAAAVVLSRPSLNRHGAAVTATAAVPVLFLSVWTSPWLAAANLAAFVGLVAVGVGYARSGSPFDTSVRKAAWRVLAAAWHGVARVVPLARSAPRPQSDAARAAGRTGRAVLLVLPLLVALAALLASADAVFASLIVPDVAVGPAFGHVALALLLAVPLVLGGLSVGSDPDEPAREGTFGTSEIAVVLGLAVAVLGLFVISQLLAMTDAGQRLVDEAGLTPAEYARSGFFQLCWASLVIVAYLALARWLAAPGVFDRALVRGLSGTVPVLGLGLVVVGLRRMALYDRAFGLTMLRLAVIVAAVWIGIVLVMMAARNLGLRPARDWLAGSAVAAGLGLLLVVDLANAEAFVVRHNVARAAVGDTVDVDYLATLSDDAVPAIAGALERSDDPLLRRQLADALRCRGDLTGVAALNLAAATAAGAREEHCDGAGQR